MTVKLTRLPFSIPMLAPKAQQAQPIVERTRGSAWMGIRGRIVKRDEGLCQPCRRADRYQIGTQVDHKRPLFDGGTDDEWNLELTCKACHDLKSKLENARRVTGGSL